MTPPLQIRDRRAGFSLVELMVASAVSVLVIGGLVVAMLHMRESYRTMQEFQDAEQNARIAMDMIVRDIRMSGYGFGQLTVGSSLSNWLGAVNSTLEITDNFNGSGKDRLRVVGAVDPSVARLNANAIKGTNRLVTVGTVTGFDAGKLVCVGGCELARILSRSGNTLTIATSPTSTRGLTYSYTTNATVDLVKIITYDWATSTANYPNGPYLRRTDSEATYAAEWQRMIASEIEDFQLRSTTSGISISLVGRSKTRSTKLGGDGYRRFTLNTTVNSRNPMP